MTFIFSLSLFINICFVATCIPSESNADGPCFLLSTARLTSSDFADADDACDAAEEAADDCLGEGCIACFDAIDWNNISDEDQDNAVDACYDKDKGGACAEKECDSFEDAVDTACGEDDEDEEEEEAPAPAPPGRLGLDPLKAE